MNGNLENFVSRHDPAPRCAGFAALEVRVTNRLYAAVFAGFALNAGLVIAVVKLL